MRPFFLTLLLLAQSMICARAQLNKYKVFQVGTGIHRTQVLNDGFISLQKDKKIMQAYGFNAYARYIVNPLILRISCFSEKFGVDDINYVYTKYEAKIKGFDGSIGLNILPQTYQVLYVSAGYKVGTMGSFNESSQVVASKTLKFPFWSLGYSTNPENKLAFAINFDHPVNLTQDNFSQIMVGIIYKL